mgnify:CR=1 FL=1
MCEKLSDFTCDIQFTGNIKELSEYIDELIDKYTCAVCLNMLNFYVQQITNNVLKISHTAVILVETGLIYDILKLELYKDDVLRLSENNLITLYTLASVGHVIKQITVKSPEILDSTISIQSSEGLISYFGALNATVTADNSSVNYDSNVTISDNYYTDDVHDRVHLKIRFGTLVHDFFLAEESPFKITFCDCWREIELYSPDDLASFYMLQGVPAAVAGLHGIHVRCNATQECVEAFITYSSMNGLECPSKGELGRWMHTPIIQASVGAALDPNYWIGWMRSLRWDKDTYHRGRY